MKQSFIVTIDTEGHDGRDPIEKLIFGETAEGKYGIEFIMDELDVFGVKALFFVDFAEAWDYGEEKVRNVVEKIIQRGHNVGVHVHPDHMADKKRLFLYEYTKEEQYEIISKCTQLYEKIVGFKPLSFRAGKYSANLDTLDILCELGYQYDFSAFYHQQWCGIDPAFTINAPCKYKKLIEFPVTMHTTFEAGPIKREDKIDIEGMTSRELRYALEKVIKQNFPVAITLFFHSFSLLKWRDQPDTPTKKEKNIQKLKKAIKYVYCNEDLSFICEADLKNIETLSPDKAIHTQINWKSSFRGLIYTLLRAIKIAKYNRKAKLLVMVMGILFVFIIALILLFILRAI